MKRVRDVPGRPGRRVFLPHRGLRRLSAAGLACLGLVVALFAHLVQGGGIPAGEPLALICVATGVLMFPLVGRRVGVVRTVVHLAALQAVVHVVANAFAGSHSGHAASSACATLTPTSVMWHGAAVLVLAVATLRLESLALSLLLMLFGSWSVVRATLNHDYSAPRPVAFAFAAAPVALTLRFVGASLCWRGPPLTG
ncbi:unannotated protein [freshwater metagenome]|uniref:Unannotated protein n=1 Tax=freshwater metagenome TaxID=449393 RepID=A0A6J7KE54_9ZZZZ